MPLLGPAAMLLAFDVEPAFVAEHDHWHSHEHLPERLSIPGFLRGTRWTAVRGGPRFLVLYEVASLGTLTSAAYLERLNQPSPWTQQMMNHYRGMSRGLCTVVASEGLGLGSQVLVVRFGRAPGAEDAVDAWLRQAVLTALPGQPGLGSAHLLRGAAPPPMTNEQRIRGADADVDGALLLSAYDERALVRAEAAIVGPAGLVQAGATQVRSAVYTMHYTLSAAEMSGPV